MFDLKKLLVFLSIIIVGLPNTSEAMNKSSSESSDESSDEKKNIKWEYVTPTRTVVQFYNTYLCGQGYKTSYGESVSDLPYNELSQFMKKDIKQEFNKWKTNPYHLSPLSEFEIGEQMQANKADNIIINIAGGVALGLPIADNTHVFLQTSGLIMCNALVITNGQYTFLAHVTPDNTEELTIRCMNYFKKHTKTNENNIQVFSYYVKKGFKSEKIFNIIQGTISTKFPSIHGFQGIQIAGGEIMINIKTGQSVENTGGSNYTYHLAAKFGESKQSTMNIQAMTERYISRHHEKPNEQESWEIIVKDHALRMGQVLDKLCNIKSKTGLGVKDPWFVSTLTPY